MDLIGWESHLLLGDNVHAKLYTTLQVQKSRLSNLDGFFEMLHVLELDEERMIGKEMALVDSLMQFDELLY